MVLGSPVPLFQAPALENGRLSPNLQNWIAMFYAKCGAWNQQAAPTAAVTLTTAFGTAGTALADTGTSAINDNFASVLAKTDNLEARVSALYAALQNMGGMA